MDLLNLARRLVVVDLVSGVELAIILEEDGVWDLHCNITIAITINVQVSNCSCVQLCHTRRGIQCISSTCGHTCLCLLSDVLFHCSGYYQ